MCDCSSTPIFPRHDGELENITASHVSQLVNACVHGLGIDDTLHRLRHLFGSQVYAGTPDIRVVQELMGHSSPVTTSLYVQFSNKEAAAAVEAMSALRPSWAAGPDAAGSTQATPGGLPAQPPSA